MSYTVRLSDPAAKTLARIDKATQRRILARLHELAENPYDPRISKPLVGMDGMRSSRVGAWRILYTVHEAEKVVYVVAIRPRGKAYRKD